MSFSDATAAVSAELADRSAITVCEGVDKWYGDFKALKGVSANTKEREVVVVLGPPGSGKSTWIRCINRLALGNGCGDVLECLEIAVPLVDSLGDDHVGTAELAAGVCAGHG